MDEVDVDLVEFFKDIPYAFLRHASYETPELKRYFQAAGVHEGQTQYNRFAIMGLLKQVETLYEEDRDIQTAVALASACCSFAEQTLPQGDPLLLAAYNCQAGIAMGTGNFQVAMVLACRLLELIMSIGGVTHPDYESVRSNAIRACKEAGNHAAEEEIILECFQEESKSNQGSVYRHRSLCDLATCQCDRGKYQEAINTYNQALRQIRSEGYDQESNYSVLLVNISIAYRADGQLEKAEESLLEAQAAMDLRGHQTTEDYAGMLNALAAVRRAQCKFDDAVKIYQRAIEIISRLNGADDSRIAVALNNRAIAQVEMAQYTEAKSDLEESLRINHECYSPRHSCSVLVVANLACVEHMLSHFERAIEVYDVVIEHFTKEFGPFHEHVEVTKRNREAALQRIKQVEMLPLAAA